MAERIDLPPILQGDEGSQLQQLWSYLYQLSESINNNLDAIGGNELTDAEMASMQQILKATGKGAAGQETTVSSDYETLKSLIIKTADFVQTTMTEYRMSLLSESVASGQFGRYVRNTGLDVIVNPQGITQNYTFQEIVQDLKQYEVNAKNYIKTGLLRMDGSIPVYGAAIGKDIVTISNDGTETYHDENKVAELTAEELSFWQNSVKIASYTGTDQIFYVGGVAKMKINSDGVTILNGSTKLAELISTGLKLYYNGTVVADYSSSGVSFYSNGTEIMSFQNGRIYARNSMEFSSGDIIMGNWSLTSGGLMLEYPGDHLRFEFADSAYASNNATGIYKENGEAGGRTGVLIGVGSGSGSSYNRGIFVFSINNENGTQVKVFRGYSGWPNYLGTSSYHWDKGFIDDITYVNATQSSSRDIKHDIQSMGSMGERLDLLRPVTFVYDNDTNERQRAGLIYEEAIEIMPEICTGREDEKGINYVELIPMLLKEIQELRARVAAMEERQGG